MRATPTKRYEKDKPQRKSGVQKMFYIFVITMIIPSINVFLIHIIYFSSSQTGPKKPKNLNILILYADDWRHDTIQSHNPNIRTPNLLQLSKEGIQFKKNCVTTSVCWISRATLHTGQYLSRHQSYFTWDPVFTYYDWNETCYPGILRTKADYEVAHVGKWHYLNFPEENYDYSNIYHGYHINPDTNMHVTQQNEEDALDFLKNRNISKPFLLTVAFFAPHAVDEHVDQFIPQNSTLDLYQNDSFIQPPSITNESWNRLPYFFDENNEGRNRWHWRFDTPSKHVQMMKNYYRLVSGVDAACGNIIQELKKQEIYNDTFIIFTTDNGLYHAEHGLADKWYPHQESIRVPLIIKDPRMSPEKVGTTNSDLTLNIDLAPTIVSVAGLTPPDRMQGTDISELYLSKGKKKKKKWRRDFFYEHPTVDGHPETFISSSQALVTHEFKYIVWPGWNGFEQLFHLKKDPMEENDVVNQTEYQDVLANMRDRFEELRLAAN